MSDYVLHLDENICFDMFDEYTNHTKGILSCGDVWVEIANNTQYVDNVLQKNTYQE